MGAAHSEKAGTGTSSRQLFRRQGRAVLFVERLSGGQQTGKGAVVDRIAAISETERSLHADVGSAGELDLCVIHDLQSIAAPICYGDIAGDRQLAAGDYRYRARTSNRLGSRRSIRKSSALQRDISRHNKRCCSAAKNFARTLDGHLVARLDI